MVGPFASMPRRQIWPIGPTWTCSSSISTPRAPLLMGMANLRMNRLSLLELLVRKLSANRGIGVVALPLMPNVVFRIAVQAVLGLIMPQPALAWLPQHLRRFQKGDPHPHVAPASPDPPEVVLSFLLAFASRLLGLVVFLFSHSCLLLHVRSRVGRGFLVH